MDESSFANWSSKSQLERDTLRHDLLVINQAAAEAVMGVEGASAVLEQMNGLRESSGITVQIGPQGVIEEG